MLDECARRLDSGDLFEGLLSSNFRKAGIQSSDGGLQVRRKNDVAFRHSSQSTAGSKRFGVERINAFPA